MPSESGLWREVQKSVARPKRGRGLRPARKTKKKKCPTYNASPSPEYAALVRPNRNVSISFLLSPSSSDPTELARRCPFFWFWFSFFADASTSDVDRVPEICDDRRIATKYRKACLCARSARRTRARGEHADQAPVHRYPGPLNDGDSCRTCRRTAKRRDALSHARRHRSLSQPRDRPGMRRRMFICHKINFLR